MVLFLHNRYRTTGGEERVVEDLLALVRDQLGEQAELLERDSATLGRGGAAVGLLRGGSKPDDVGRAVRLTGARVVHAHNLNPTLGWRALAAARAAGARVVLHLHQYRLVCAIGVCFTRGAECTRCHGRDTLPGVRLNCRGSRGEAAAYGASLALWQRRLAEQADAVIVPSVFARERLRELGAPLDWERVHVLPPPVAVTASESRVGRGLLRAGGLAPGAGEGSRRRDRRLPGGGRRAGGGRRRPRARGLCRRGPPARRCASPATSTTPSSRGCAPARRLRWRPRARPRPSGWPRPRRWRRGCRWLRAGLARYRSWSTRRVWCRPGTRRARAGDPSPGRRSGRGGGGGARARALCAPRRSRRCWRRSTTAARRKRRRLRSRPRTSAPRALITGLTGQDGSFLAELLLAKGYASPASCAVSQKPPSAAPSTCADGSSWCTATCSTPELPACGGRAEPADGDLPPRGPPPSSRPRGNIRPRR